MLNTEESKLNAIRVVVEASEDDIVGHPAYVEADPIEAVRFTLASFAADIESADIQLTETPLFDAICTVENFLRELLDAREAERIRAEDAKTYGRYGPFVPGETVAQTQLRRRSDY
jgi:hypothetical protein